MANSNPNDSEISYSLVDRDSGVLDVDGNDGTVQIGRAFFSIWQLRGYSNITYSGSKRVVLNLKDAPLTTDVSRKSSVRLKMLKRDVLFRTPQPIRLDIGDASYDGAVFSRAFLRMPRRPDTISAGI